MVSSSQMVNKMYPIWGDNINNILLNCEAVAHTFRLVVLQVPFANTFIQIVVAVDWELTVKTENVQLDVKLLSFYFQ